MKNILPLAQIVISLVLITFILLQAKGQGLGGAFGGGGEFYRSKRGAEKILFYATIIVAIFFLLTSVLGMIIS